MKIAFLSQTVIAWLMACVVGSNANAQSSPAPIVVAPVLVRSMSTGQSFVGTVMPVKTAVIGSAVDGRVVEHLVREGDRVTAGQTLAQLLTATISLEVTAARAELEFRQQQLNELLNGSRPEEIEQARARMDSLKALVTYNEAKFKRARKLHEQSNTITREQLDEAISAMRNAKEQYEEAKAAHQLAVAGPRKEKIAQARARLNIQRALADRLADQLKKHTIIARFDGYITAEHTEVGAWLSRGDPVVDIVALDDVDVRVAVLEDHIPHVKVGQQVRVEIPSLPQRVFRGLVAAIVPQADLRARTFPVKIRLNNELTESGPLLKAGMLARALLPVGKVAEASMVPKDAVVLGGDSGPAVFVFEPNSVDTQQGKVTLVPVQLGIAEGHLIQVHSELSANQLVVVQGNERLQSGQIAKVTRSIGQEQLLQAKIPSDR